MKIVLNKCYGGFGLSPEAIQMYLTLKGKCSYFYIRDYKNNMLLETDINDINSNSFYCLLECLGNTIDLSIGNDWYMYNFDIQKIDRTDSALIKVVETLKEKANGNNSKLVIIDIDINDCIEEHDGYENFVF